VRRRRRRKRENERTYERKRDKKKRRLTFIQGYRQRESFGTKYVSYSRGKYKGTRGREREGVNGMEGKGMGEKEKEIKLYLGR
jgi:hypothetical protein